MTHHENEVDTLMHIMQENEFYLHYLKLGELSENMVSGM
jgi:hypothetical protein